MPLFRKIPKIIEAVQFDDIPRDDPPGVFRRPEDDSPYVVTIHGQRCYIESGDWMIPEPDGIHYYPCKDDVFKATYEIASHVSIPSAWLDTPQVEGVMTTGSTPPLKDGEWVIAADHSCPSWYLSEPVLAKEWNTPAEDEAWKDL